MVKKAMLEAHVDNLLRTITGKPELARDKDGDWPFSLDTAVMYVRVVGETDAIVRVSATAAVDVKPSPELFELLNSMNDQVIFVRILWHDGVIYVVNELVGETLDLEELESMLDMVASAADNAGPVIVEKCGGSTPRQPLVSTEPTKEDVPVGQYL